MTTLHNEISIAATAAEIWAVLTDLERLEQYDPAVVRSTLISGARSGVGAARRCEVRPRGWFEEQVTRFEPQRGLTITLTDCSFPITGLEHDYELVPDGDATLVRQRMDYSLRYGALGRLLDRMFMRRQWDAGIKGFLEGLREHVIRSREGRGATTSPTTPVATPAKN